MKRLENRRLRRRDWTGDGVLTLVAGVALVVAVFLPWVNEELPGRVNYSLSKPDGINGVLQTQWGRPALALAIAVVIAAVAIALTRPRRFSPLLGVLVAVFGVAVAAVGSDAAAHIGYRSPGVGMFVTVFTGVLLVPIGLAAALVALVLVRPAQPPTDPPAPETAPPS